MVDKLHEQTQRALQEPRIRDRLQVMGVEPMPMGQAEFEEFVRQQMAADAALVKTIGLKVEQ